MLYSTTATNHMIKEIQSLKVLFEKARSQPSERCPFEYDRELQRIVLKP